MKTNIKLCFIQPVQSPYWTERLKVLAQHQDLDLTLLLEKDNFAHRPGWKPEQINGVHIEILNSSVLSITGNGDDLGYRIQGVRSIPWRLPFALWRLRPKVVVLCNATQVLLALPLKILLGIRIALIVEDTVHAKRNMSRLTRLVKTLAYRRANRCYAFSEDAVQFLEHIGNFRDIERSSWSLDMNYFKENNKIHSNNCMNDEAPHNITVIFVGAFTVNKGIHLLVESWRQLPVEIRNKAKLLLVGSGPLHTQIDDKIRRFGLDEIEIVGQVPYEKVRDLLCGSHLFVLPTLVDLCSLTVLEAMASSCAVITTPYNGARELVAEGESGWIVDPLQSRALTEVLRQALSQRAKLVKMGTAARARVAHMDNISVMSQFALSLSNLATDGKK